MSITKFKPILNTCLAAILLMAVPFAAPVEGSVTTQSSKRLSARFINEPTVIATIKIGEGGYVPHDVAVNPANNRIYTANGESHDVFVIDGINNTILAKIPITGIFSTGPMGIAVNPTTNRIYTANWGINTVSIIDGSTNNVVGAISVGETPASIAVNPATNRIYVTNHNPNSVTVIDGTSNSVIAIIPVGSSPDTVAVNPLTNRIYTANYGSNSISVIDGSTNGIVANVPVTTPRGVAINTTSNRIYTATTDNNSVFVIDGYSNSVVANVAVGSAPQSVAVNPATNRIYTPNYDNNTVSVIDGSSNSLVATVQVRNNPWKIAVNPITNRIYEANYFDAITVIDGSSNLVLATVSLANRPSGIAVNYSTNRIYTANLSSCSVTVIDGSTNGVVATISLAYSPIDIAVNPATNLVYTANYRNNNVSVINGSNNSLITTISVGSYPQNIAVNTTTNRIYVSNYQSASVSVIDGASNSVIATIPIGIGPGGIAVNPATNRIYTANYANNTVSVINGTSNNVVATIPIGTSPDGIAVNLSTNRIYTNNYSNHTVSVIDGATNSVMATVPLAYAPYDIAVNPTTNRICTCNYYFDNITVIDGPNNSVVATIAVGKYPTDITVNPTTNRIYTANFNSDTVSVIWDPGSTVLPVVTTGTATLIDSDDATVHATLNGNLISLGDATSENVAFEYWLQGSTEIKTAPNPPTTVLTRPGTFSTTVSSLAGNKNYVYRAVGYSNQGVTTYGDNITFKAVPDWRKDIQAGDILISYPYKGSHTILADILNNPMLHWMFQWEFNTLQNEREFPVDIDYMNSTIYLRHTGIYIGEDTTTGQGKVIESYLPPNPPVGFPVPGVYKTDIWTWDSKYKSQVQCWRAPANLSSVIKNNAITFANKQLPSPFFKFYNIFAYLLNTKYYLPSSPFWYCSELCWASYWNEGNGYNIQYNQDNPDKPKGKKVDNPIHVTTEIISWICDYFHIPKNDLLTLIGNTFPPCYDIAVFPHDLEGRNPGPSRPWLGGHTYPNDLGGRLTLVNGHVDGDILQSISGEYIIVFSPIDIIVTTPDGHILRKGYSDIPGASYDEGDYYGDGHLEAIIYIPGDLIGTFHLTVVPSAGANPSDLYTILFIGNKADNGIPVAIATPVSAIPPQGYNVYFDGSKPRLVLVNDVRSASAYTNLGVVTFNISAGSISDFNSISAVAMPCGANGYIFPYGMFSYNITNLTPGQSVSVTIRLPNPMPLGTKYFKCQNKQGVDCSPIMSRPDTNTIVLTLTDGGLGDADGTANGTIVDPGGPAFPLDSPTSHGGFMPSAPQVPVSLPGISVKSASLSTSKVAAGKPFIVTAVMTSPVNDTTRIKLYINNQEESSQLVTVNQGKEVSINFTISKNEPGTYAVYVESINAGSITVGEVEEQAGPNIILWIVIALVILAIVLRAIYVWRKLKNEY